MANDKQNNSSTNSIIIMIVGCDALNHRATKRLVVNPNCLELIGSNAVTHRIEENWNGRRSQRRREG
jgi:hypothetical protein